MSLIQRIRLAINIEDPSSSAVNILDTRGRTPQIFRGSKVRIELAFYQSDTFLTDFADIAAIGIGFKSLANPTGNYLSGPFTSAPNGALEEEDWKAGASANCHAAFDLTPDQTNIGNGQFDAQLVIFSQDTEGVSDPLGKTKVTVYESGLAGVIGSPAPAATRVAQPLQLLGPDGLFYTLSIVNADDGGKTLQISNNGQP